MVGPQRRVTKLPRRADVVIVGAGCTGASVAFRLARAGIRDVLVLEQGLPASGPTGRSGAQLIPRSEVPLVAALKWEGLAFYRRFEEHTGGSADFRTIGYVAVAQPEALDALRTDVENLRALGSNVALLDARAASEAFDLLAVNEREVALVIPEVGFADPVAATQALLDSARRDGARAHVLTRVTGLRRDGNTVTGVATTAGDVAAGTVILATGIWTNEVLASVGLRAPIAWHRVEVGIFRRPDTIVDHPVIVDFPGGTYARPEGDRWTFIGTAGPGVGGELLPDRAARVAGPSDYQETVTPSHMADLARRFEARVPRARGLYLRRGHACLYDRTPDGHPVLDLGDRMRGLAVTCGMSGAGFVQSVGIGRVLAAWVVDPATEDPLRRLYAMDRFETGRPIEARIV
jgi:sarcosine oxidase subunit beta